MSSFAEIPRCGPAFELLGEVVCMLRASVFPIDQKLQFIQSIYFSNHCFSKFHIRTLEAKCTENAICWIISLHPESVISMKDWPGNGHVAPGEYDSQVAG